MAQKLGLRTIEIIIAASVVVISVASLFVAVFQGIVMDRTLKASVMPVIQAGTGNFDLEDEEWVLNLNVRNTGLGPARIAYLRIMQGDQPISSMGSWLAECCAPPDLTPAERQAYIRGVFERRELVFITDSMDGRYLSPQETTYAYRASRPDPETQPDGFDVWVALNSARFDVQIEICYCSVFDECWRARFPSQSREDVRQCVIPVRTP